MGAQTDGLKSAAFKLDTQKKAAEGANRRREAIRRRGTGGYWSKPGRDDMARIQPFPGPGDDQARIQPFPGGDFNRPWRGQKPGSPWEQKEGAHILNEGRKAERDFSGINFGPGRADNIIEGLFPGNKAGGDFTTFRAFLDQLQKAKTGGK